MALSLMSPHQGGHRSSQASSCPCESTAAASTATTPTTPTATRGALAATALARGLALAGEGVSTYVAKRGFHGIGLTSATASCTTTAATAATATASRAFIARPTRRAA